MLKFKIPNTKKGIEPYVLIVTDDKYCGFLVISCRKILKAAKIHCEHIGNMNVSPFSSIVSKAISCKKGTFIKSIVVNPFFEDVMNFKERILQLPLKPRYILAAQIEVSSHREYIRNRLEDYLS